MKTLTSLETFSNQWEISVPDEDNIGLIRISSKESRVTIQCIIENATSWYINIHHINKYRNRA